jgi:antitoxin ParD1/3/4
MARNTSINLGTHFDTFINQQLSHGRYGSASEVIRAGLRLLEERETKLNTLRSMLTDGENSGISDYSLSSLIDELDGMSS